jgi:ribulose-5-phosphate 4-epimerase/fuculose-1-phosphate aldolase
MNGEGYIKYNCIWEDSPIEIPAPVLESLGVWREKLYHLSLIGVYENNIGYGNISIRNKDGTFIITGSATGGKATLEPDDYALVQEWQIEKNRLVCSGKTKASSESLSHAAIYDAVPEVRAVVHVHSEDLWKRYLHKFPTTEASIEFGTPEMALEIMRVLQNKNNIAGGIVIMGGHREGILTFGRDLDAAGKRLMHYSSAPNAEMRRK